MMSPVFVAGALEDFEIGFSAGATLTACDSFSRR
jgi:hypothetical protein